LRTTFCFVVGRFDVILVVPVARPMLVAFLLVILIEVVMVAVAPALSRMVAVIV